MSDYGTMVSRIKDELKRSDLETQIKRAIITSLAFYKRHRFTWNHTRATLALTPNTEYYQLPSNFVEVDTLILQSGNSELDYLYERTHHWLDREKEWDGYRSRPAVFAIQNYELRLYPTPDQTYTILMSYQFEQKSITYSATTTASNEWMTQGEELVRLHAKIDVLENIIRGPESFQESQALRMRERDIYKQLKREYNRASSSGTIMPWGSGTRVFGL